MQPDSRVLLALVALGIVAMFVLLARSKRLAARLVTGVLAFLLSSSLGVLVVNDYYGYYTSWGSAVADLSGNGNAYAATQANAVLASPGHASGRLEVVDLKGPASGIDRQGLVYLPPQYFEAGYRSVRFPVIELFHGTPGNPAQWVNQIDVTRIAQQLIDDHRMGPVVLVMPDSNGGFAHQEECLNTPSFQDATYVTRDVPADIRARFRVSTDTGQWGALGESSGGYCAANLALQHPTDFGSAAAIDGYYRPQDGNAAALLPAKSAAAKANDPLRPRCVTVLGGGPLPAMWFAAGTGVTSDYLDARGIVAALRRAEAVPFLVMKGADHTMAAVRRAVPAALTWTWQQISTPDLRRDFPTDPHHAGGTTTIRGTVLAERPGHPLISTRRVHGRFAFTTG